MYCVVICLHGMHCVDSFAGSLILLGIVNVLVDTRGKLNLIFCHSSAILQGQFNGRTYMYIGREGVLLYINGSLTRPYMSHVNFKKLPCRCVECKGQEPLSWTCSNAGT